MTERIYRNNFFLYGEVGERLNGIRESQIYEHSAQVIRNFLVTELGNLKVAKKFEKIPNTINSIIEVIDTRNEFYIIITTTHVRTHRKSDNQLLYTLNHGLSLNNSINCKMFEERLIICGETPKVFEFDVDTGNIGISDFMNLLEWPVMNKEEIKMDLYKVYQVSGEPRVTLLTTYTNPRLEIKNNKVYLYNSKTEIQRMYLDYRGNVNKDDITSPAKDLVFAVFHKKFESDEEKSYHIGNTKINFTNPLDDALYGSQYFTGVDIAVANGDLSFGELKPLNANFTDAGLFQNRFYIIQDGVFYFSKIDNYFNFKNDIQSDAPFYFKPSPINNQKPLFLKSKVGNGIYVVTNKGCYVIGYNKALTPSSYQVFIAGEVPGTVECELVGDDFYYIAESGELKCVQAVPNEFGNESFKTFSAEKYDIKNRIKNISKVIIEGKSSLLCTSKIGSEMYLYDSIELNNFRRVSLDIECETKLYGRNEMIVSDNCFYMKSNLNYPEATLRLNPPFMQTSKGGSYSNDYSSSIERVFLKLLNEDKQAIKGVYIAGTPLNNMGTDDNLFSTCKLERSTKILNGYEIKIVTNENDKILEVLGIDTKIKIASD